jgi:hypothetical protein
MIFRIFKRNREEIRDDDWKWEEQTSEQQRLAEQCHDVYVHADFEYANHRMTRADMCAAKSRAEKRYFDEAWGEENLNKTWGWRGYKNGRGHYYRCNYSPEYRDRLGSGCKDD